MTRTKDGRTFWAFLVLVVLFVSFEPARFLYAGESYVKGAGEKFARGFSNMATSPLEFPAMIEHGLEDDDPIHFYLDGPFTSTTKFLTRFSVGIYELTTFWFPQDPILEPLEYLPGIEGYHKEKFLSRNNVA